MRYISHHDIMRVWERAARRACLPMSLSKGFNPRPKFRFALALGLGITGADEVVDIKLDRWMHPSEVEDALAGALPEGIEIKSVRSVPERSSVAVRRVCYRVKLLPGHCLRESELAAFLQKDEMRITRTKGETSQEKDIRPFIHNLTLRADELEMTLDIRSDGTARPEEVMDALGCERGTDYLLNQIVRTRVVLVSPA